MKKTSLIGLFCLLLITAASAQKKDFFVGKWFVQVKGTPMGDSKMTVDLKRKSGKLEGLVVDKDGDTHEITEVEEASDKITIHYKYGLMSISLLMIKKDQTHFSGKLLNKFDADGVRLKK